MGFWKSLGKGLLKVAPIAASFIPGVGPIAGAALSAGLGAANAKVSGGGLKDVLMGAGTGAAMSGLGGAGRGLAPSKGFMGTLGNIGKEVGKQAIRNPGLILGSGGQSNLGNRGNLPDYVMNATGGQRTAIPRGLGPQNLNFPNLATSIARGRRMA